MLSNYYGLSGVSFNPFRLSQARREGTTSGRSTTALGHYPETASVRTTTVGFPESQRYSGSDDTRHEELLRALDSMFDEYKRSAVSLAPPGGGQSVEAGSSWPSRSVYTVS